MKEYKIKGLSCPNCAAKMESEIKQLPSGENAQLQYNSSKLVVNEDVDLKNVKKILASDGAAIVEDHEHSHHHEDTKDIKRLLIGSLTFFICALLLSHASEVASIVCYVVAIMLSGYKTFLKGLKNVIHFTFNIDTLMTIALIGAIAIGEWKEAAIVAMLFGVNEWLEGVGMQKARKSMEALLSVAPKIATRIRDGKEQMVPIESLCVGDEVIVKSGEKIPSDGIIIEGQSSVNEAAITGESLPVEKYPHDFVFGGSINHDGRLKVRIEKAYEDSSLAKILHLVEEAQETKTPSELFVNQFAKYYTPIIMIIAALVMVIPPLFLDGDLKGSFYQGLAVLIIGCPCAFVLSFPIAIISGITVNARNGILVKGGVFLEQLGKLNMIAFDKTGTLTNGEPHVEKEVVYQQDAFYSIAKSIEKNSTHPLAAAILAKVDPYQVEDREVGHVQTVPGQGVIATIQNQEYYLGNEKLIPEYALTDEIKKAIVQLKEEGLTLVIVSSEKEVYGMFGIADEIREEAKQVMNELHKIGIKKTIMLTGDHQKTAARVAKTVGVTEYYSDLLPEEKVAKISELSKQGKIAMIGDGINDAPALATADVGIAMGKGTDSAIETADIVLMQDHLGKLPYAIQISQKVNRIIRFNIALALSLKLIALLLTIPGWLTLWIAILSDMGATIIVTLISLTILIERKSVRLS